MALNLFLLICNCYAILAPFSLSLWHQIVYFFRSSSLSDVLSVHLIVMRNKQENFKISFGKITTFNTQSVDLDVPELD